jgi:hypothetical protein
MVPQLKKPLSPLPRTEETGIFPILRTVRLSSNIGEFDMIGETLPFKIILQDFGFSRTKTEVDVNGDQFVMDGNPFQTLFQEVKQGEAILSSRNAN